jgi:hypothetical protein
MAQGYETRDNTGTLFANDRRTAENQPNAKGKALIGGQWYWVSAWTKSGQNAGKFQSLAFELMTAEQVAQYVNGGGARQQGNGGGRGQPPARQQPQQRPQQRRQAEPPFGEEKQFEEADIPF